MAPMEYGRRNVYLQSNKTITKDELVKARPELGTIVDAHFFTIGPDREVLRAQFDRSAIDSNRMGLALQVKYGWGHAPTYITGFHEIAEFLSDTNAFGQDLTLLKGRAVTAYEQNLQLLGIGIYPSDV